MTCISGERGIGKTYHMVKLAYEYYLRGWLIITNFSFVYANITCKDQTEFLLLLQEIGRFKDGGFVLSDLSPSFKHSGIAIFFDEAHLTFGSDHYRRYASDPNFAYVINFLAQARKQDVEVVYTVQDTSKIDVNFRRYTDTWLHLSPLLNISRKVLVQDPNRPEAYRHEVRYPIPIYYEESHNLKSDAPIRSYRTHEIDEGITVWHETATIKHRRMRLAGWMDSFPYTLYNSHEILNIEHDSEEDQFPLLKGLAVVPHIMRRERFPTIKRFLGMHMNDDIVPPKIKFKTITLPAPDMLRFSKNILMQPEEFMEDMLKKTGSKSQKKLNRRSFRSFLRSPSVKRAATDSI